MSAVVRCPKCSHEFVADLATRGNSTMRSLDAATAPIRDDAPMCVCGHVKVLHGDDAEPGDHNGSCTLCGDGTFRGNLTAGVARDLPTRDCGAFVAVDEQGDGQ